MFGARLSGHLVVEFISWLGQPLVSSCSSPGLLKPTTLCFPFEGADTNSVPYPTGRSSTETSKATKYQAPGCQRLQPFAGQNRLAPFWRVPPLGVNQKEHRQKTNHSCRRLPPTRLCGQTSPQPDALWGSFCFQQGRLRRAIQR